MVLGCLRGDPEKELTYYLRKALRLTLWTICCYLSSASDKIFSELKNKTLKPPLREWVRQAWIYDDTWEVMDAMLTACREGSHRNIQKLIRQIRVGLSTDHKIRVEEEVRTIESLIASDPQLVIDAWV